MSRVDRETMPDFCVIVYYSYFYVVCDLCKFDLKTTEWIRVDNNITNGERIMSWEIMSVYGVIYLLVYGIAIWLFTQTVKKWNENALVVKAAIMAFTVITVVVLFGVAVIAVDVKAVVAAGAPKDRALIESKCVCCENGNFTSCNSNRCCCCRSNNRWSGYKRNCCR